MNLTLDLACDLIACPSETPSDAHCQQIIGERLQAMGFTLETVVSGPADFEVTNLWAKRPATLAPGQTAATRLLVFAGHTDVVPSGPVKQWDSDPFKPTLRDGKLFGRGAADMKTSLAAFVVATEEFVAAQPETPLAIGFLLTSDEEGPALDGTVKVCELLQARGEVHGLLHRGRTHLGRAHRRHDQEWPARLAGRQAHREGHAGPHCLPAPGQQPHPPAGTGAGRAGGHRVGPWQRTFSRPPAGRSATSMAAPAPAT